jgi:hypothetical protein
MKRSYTLLKVAAIVSSITLVAGFICYRAGAFDSFLRPAVQPIEPQSSPRSQEHSPDGPIMSSSKSIILSNPSMPSKPDSEPPSPSKPPAPENTPRIVIPSPKAGPIFIPDSSKTPTTPQQQVKPPAP